VSDEDTRTLERRWKETGALADGERWVAAVLRETGTPILPLISITMQTARSLKEIGFMFQPQSRLALLRALTFYPP